MSTAVSIVRTLLGLLFDHTIGNIVRMIPIIRLPKLERGPVSRGFLALLLVILFFGLTMLFSASYSSAYATSGKLYSIIKPQVIIALVGLAFMWLLSNINYRALRLMSESLYIITIVLLIAAIAVACFPLALQFESDRNLAATTATTAKEVAGWPYPQAEDKLTAARAYNKKLAESGQPILGEAVDPFAAAQGGSQASGEDSASKKDKEYQSLLNTGNGVMGTIKVPKQSINLPATCTARRCRWEVNPPIRSLPGTAGWLKR